MVFEEEISKVQEILTKADDELRTVEVKKNIDLELDVGNLLVVDTNEIERNKFRSSSVIDDYLKSLARDGVQAITNKVWQLPTETIDNLIYAIMPPPSTRLPREKPPPKPKPPTKWEQFAREKGVTSKKKDSKVWDDILKKWIPRFGFCRAQAEKDKNWIMEVPGGGDPYEDMFGKAAAAKKERIAKNEYMRLRNLAKKKNIKVPNVGITTETMTSKREMRQALVQTRFSTASLGKFQKTLPKEKDLPERRGIKRKLPANNISREGVKNDNSRMLEVFSKMKRKELDFETAVNKQLKMENVEMSHQGKKNMSSGRRSKKGLRQRGKSEHKASAKGKGMSAKTKGHQSKYGGKLGKKESGKLKFGGSKGSKFGGGKGGGGKAGGNKGKGQQRKFGKKGK